MTFTVNSRINTVLWVKCQPLYTELNINMVHQSRETVGMSAKHFQVEKHSLLIQSDNKKVKEKERKPFNYITIRIKHERTINVIAYHL